MTTAIDIQSELRREVATRMRSRVRDIDPEAHFVRDMGLSSLDLLGLLAFAEKTYGVRFPDETLYELTTINRVVAAISTCREFEAEDCR